MVTRGHSYTTLLEAAIDADMEHSSPLTRRVVVEANQIVARLKSAADLLVYGELTERTAREQKQLGMETRTR